MNFFAIQLKLWHIMGIKDQKYYSHLSTVYRGKHPKDMHKKFTS